MKILVVDDDPDILRLCARALEARGHVVTACLSGGPALQAALRESFDLALCDLNLPDIHGLEVVRAIKMQAPSLAVIVMSALDPREWEQASTDAGASFFLSKPLRLETLRHEVQMVEASRITMGVVLAVGDDDRHRLTSHFAGAGCRVRAGRDVADALVLLGDGGTDLVIVDGDLPDAHVVFDVCARIKVTCFVIASADFNDDAALRRGVALVVRKPASADALVLQARFLAAR